MIPSRGFVGGYELETLGLGVPFMAAFLIPALGAGRLPLQWTAMKTWPACGLLAKTCRKKATRVHLNDAVKDKWGLPVANVHFTDHPNDIAMREPRLSAGQGGL